MKLFKPSRHKTTTYLHLDLHGIHLKQSTVYKLQKRHICEL